jgi:cysteine synthase
MTDRAWPPIFGIIGNTPVVAHECATAEGPVEVLIKVEGQNPSGSVKDRAAAQMIRHAVEAGEIGDRAILEASSGNMACAVAMIGASLGIPTALVCNQNLTEDKALMIEYFGSELYENTTGPYTYQGAEQARSMAAAEPDRYYFLDQLHNWENPRAHEIGTGPEILRQVPGVTMVAASLGSGGTLTGTARGIRAERDDVAFIGVQSAPGTRFPGVGAFDDGDYVTPFLQAARDEGLFILEPHIHEADALARTRELAGSGLYCGPQTGAVIVGALEAAAELDIDSGIVVITGDAGWKNGAWIAKALAAGR